MQIGIDVGATKIEYIILHDDGEESSRSRIDCPKIMSNYKINEIVIKLEKMQKNFLLAFASWYSFSPYRFN